MQSIALYQTLASRKISHATSAVKLVIFQKTVLKERDKMEKIGQAEFATSAASQVILLVIVQMPL